MKPKAIVQIGTAFFVLVAPSVSVAREGDIPVVQSQFSVPAGQYICQSAMTYVGGKIIGSVSASGGQRNDIRVLVVKDQRVIFDSGQRASIAFSVPMTEAGTYQVCFDNRFSTISAKSVSADVKVERPRGKGDQLATGFGVGLGALGAIADLVEGKTVGEALSGGLNTASSIFSEVNWGRLRGQVRTLRGWRVVDLRGAESQADIEIIFVGDGTEVDKWCRDFLPSLYGTAPHPAWGCTRPGPPWRSVVWWRSDNQRESLRTLSHELWHTKGYWDHVGLPDGGTWPAKRGTKQAAPLRIPQPND